MVVATSTIRKPFIAVAISSSEVWYCVCSSLTVRGITVRKARMPDAGSVMRWRSSRLISPPKKITPAWRTGSVVSSVPSRREPLTKSARPDMIGSSTRSNSLSSYWPSASVVAMNSAPALVGQPVAEHEDQALAAVDRHIADERAGRARLLCRAVIGTVDDDDHLDRLAADLRGMPRTTAATVGSSL